MLYEIATNQLIETDQIDPIERIDREALDKSEMVANFPEIKTIIIDCLNMIPKDRPKAKTIKNKLWKMLKSSKLQTETNVTYIIQWIINRVNESNTLYKYNPSDKAKPL